MTTLQGSGVRLRLAREADAEFIWALRSDPVLNRHLSPTSGGPEDQRAWLARYKLREDRGDEFYFIVETRDGAPCGTVRIYDLGPDDFVFGSFILNRDKPKGAAHEVALLAFGFGFDQLGRALGRLDVRRENQQAVQFYRRFGLRQVGEDDIDLYFELLKPEFEAVRDKVNTSQPGR